MALSTFHRIYDAVPTTAGTAAEATINYYVITDAEKRTFVCVYTNGIPNVAILDFDTMYTMPEKSAAATGTDALTHAMKDYTAKAAIDAASKSLPISVSPPIWRG